MLDSTVQEAYRIFVSKVAEARKMDFTRADEIARGRVWIGSDARDLGLVDTLGDLPAAIEAAARRANLEPGTYGTRYVEPELTIPARLIREYGAKLLGNLARAGVRLPGRESSPLARVLAGADRELRELQALNDPRGLYYLCSCVMR